MAERCASLVVESCKLRKLALHLMICLLSTGHVSSLIDNLLLTNIYESIFSVIGDNELCFADGSAACKFCFFCIFYSEIFANLELKISIPFIYPSGFSSDH